MELVYKRYPVTHNEINRTISMLENPYLWFSFPKEFEGDEYDANIEAFFNENSDLLEVVKQIDPLYKDRIKHSINNGICCFSKELPQKKHWSMYSDVPREETIIVSYKRVIIEEFFAEKGFGNCFSTVNYKDNPLAFNIKNGKIEIDDNWVDIDLVVSEKDPKIRDIFWKIMLSSITKDYQHENEIRIILANKNRPEIAKNNGYEIEVPSKAINKIHLPEGINEELKMKLKNLEVCNLE